MNIKMASRIQRFVAAAVPFLALCAASPASADTVDVTVAPPELAKSVSVSTPPNRIFLAGYTVEIKNNSSGVINRPFVLWGRARTVLADASLGPFAVFAQDPQSPSYCSALSEVLPVFGEYLVRCELPNVPAGTTKFTLNFQTPAAGASLKFEWVNTRPITSFDPNDVDVGSTLVTLTTQPLSDVNTSLNTIVPSSGLTIFTGAFGNGGPDSPGSAATRTDPFTTTVVVPRFNFDTFTTASIVESVGLFSCTPSYSQCYLTDLNIPGTFQSLDIYLRVDVSRITPAGNINTAQLEYIPSDNPASPIPINNCQPGEPNSTVKRCIFSRKRYPLSGTQPALPGLEWRGDWEFRIKALENGKVRFL